MMAFMTLFFLFFSSFLFGAPEFSTALKEKKIYPMGEKIYTQKCKPIESSLYESYETLQEEIVTKNLCGSLNPTHLEALCVYLWDKNHHTHNEKTYPKLSATKEEKCPVCGMFLYKYPRWIARIHYKEKSFGFDGIKDMMKYYFEHKDGIEVILVQEYYTQKTIEATKAYFVSGSDVYGPMGNELLAFEDEKSAKVFLQDHKGKEILRFDAITQEKIFALDE